MLLALEDGSGELFPPLVTLAGAPPVACVLESSPEATGLEKCFPTPLSSGGAQWYQVNQADQNHTTMILKTKLSLEHNDCLLNRIFK